MTTQDVANRFMELASLGKYVDIQHELFHDAIECIEPDHSPMPGVKGKTAVMERLRAWYENVVETHDGAITQPIVIGNFFALGMMADMTFKNAGRQKMEELCVYEVSDGKIVKEQYFY
ncbi:nuclear transport factor 2 family protein [Chryseolinea lacunae]|uniref:Nuclear transport factor 2 family protein n=1 Tax=Chryseolinea lacunae TaxID=2801331 RepID=A0ABS1L037_9BACT|nr:nuclear transport factor 2 family protein [Chryseolinea lacunae]MBL0745083.1 nuclear transport factor 2 family protein [Chryseolinea lacunae]